MTQVVSSISGLQVYAPSAGFAPTNSADVSAIASGYQVVSATASQLYAGTAYLTSVNDIPVSASRAGNAANASMANSAYYDGTGRIISSLPDSATVSAIVSSYAESAASGKLDSSAIGTAEWMAVPWATSISGAQISAELANFANGAESARYDSDGRALTALAAESSLSSKLDASASSSFYTTANESGYIDSAYVEGQVSSKQDASAMSSYQLTADMSGYYTTANESSYVDSAYVESQVSGKQDALTFEWDADSAISAINGSALAGQGGGGGGAPIVVTGTAWDPDTSAYVYNLSSNLSGAERRVWGWQNGSKSDYIECLKDDSGNSFPMMAYVLAAGAEQMYNGGFGANGRLQFSPSKSMFTADGSNVYGLSPLTYATGASMNLSAGYFRASYRGDTVFISRGPTGTVDSSNSAQIKAVRIESHNSRGSNISAYGADSTGYLGETNMSVCRTGVSSDESGNTARSAVSARLSTGSLMFHSAGSSESMGISSIPYWNEKIDGSALGWLEV